ncbi:hypothetical protein [Pseudonocardia alni]|uniref:hypothetical protein n=1 Tax=Pseudonocardia alni TaxID=33907 RepID=UPI00279E64C6|nr:hypothetical protein PaSha_17215 [Pseudonocardia alni]
MSATRPTSCTCCGRRGVRQMVQVRVTASGMPEFTALCPQCDLEPVELQGWTADLLRDGPGDGPGEGGADGAA